MARIVRLVACAAALAAAACVPLPVQVAAPARGSVVDASGAPVAGALVVVRFDAFYDEAALWRDAFAWRTARTDASGRFRTGTAFEPGVEPWPWMYSRARVLVVLAEGYLCGEDQDLSEGGTSRIVLTPASSEEERRASCPPLAGWPEGAREYTAAWRDLYAPAGRDDAAANERDLSRAASARRSFGFGANCSGPVLDLSLAPDGSHAALVLARGGEVEVQLIDVLSAAGSSPQSLAHLPAQPLPGLVWTSAGGLTLAGSASGTLAAAPPELVAGPLDASPVASGARSPVLWSPEAPPAALADEPYEPPALDAADRHDGAGLRWAGRSFQDLREVDPTTGLPRDVLRVVGPDGVAATLTLPGEPCRPEERFGRPQLRVTADGARGLDLRWVEGACHAVAIDLASGAWSTLDDEGDPGVCATQRHMPASGLSAALPGYLRELRQLLEEAGLDPAGAFVLHIDPGGSASIETHASDGTRHVLAAPGFPLATPLRRIEVATISGNG